MFQMDGGPSPEVLCVSPRIGGLRNRDVSFTCIEASRAAGTFFDAQEWGKS